MSDVLIVEDDLLLADLLQTALEADGYRVSGIARTVDEALALAERHDPDFAVIDIQLARGDLGTEVGTRLRRITNVGIIYSTGYNLEDLSTLEGDAVMRKPYSLEDVARGLEIISEIARFGGTTLPLPRNFQLLSPVLA
jgi:DNA-binding response OmpR family regulator